MDSVSISDEAPKNKIVERVFIIKILAYSARKNKANGPPAYSTLKPETSSDSPSVKSKGARFVSANEETYHKKVKGQAGRSNHICCCAVLKMVNENPPAKRIEDRMIRAKATS